METKQIKESPLSCESYKHEQKHLIDTISSTRSRQERNVNADKKNDSTVVSAKNNEGKESRDECLLEDCSPQKRREIRQKRKKRKSLMEILFV